MIKKGFLQMGIINFVKGILIGIALVVPGLSGSMFAVVLGLYDKLLYTVNDFKDNVEKNSMFLLPVLFGTAAGILCSTKLVLLFCEKYMLQSYAFFIGLVIGSAPIVYKKMTKNKFELSKLIISLMSFIAIVSISIAAASFHKDSVWTYVSISSLSGLPDILIIFIAGMFSCSFMAIPGVSGSVMLMLINQYGTVYNSVSKMTDMLQYILKNDWVGAIELLPTVAVIIPFMSGAAIGLILIAKLLSYLLDRFESEVYYGVMGIVIGAVAVLFKDGVYGQLIYSMDAGIVKGLLGIIIVGIFIIIGSFCTKVLDK